MAAPSVSSVPSYEPYGLTFSAVHTSDLEAVERAITPKTKAIYLETPTNPTMEITDLRALAELRPQKGSSGHR